MMDGGKDQIMHMTNFILHEARNCEIARNFFQGRPGVKFPQVGWTVMRGWHDYR